MTDREKLVELLSSYFDIGDSYAYNLTRVKSAFAVGTMSLEDFEEFDDDTVADIADHLLSRGVTFEKQGEWDIKHRHHGGFRKYTGVDEFGETRTITVDERFESDEPYCPYCGKWNESVWKSYCPNCGARMKGAVNNE